MSTPPREASEITVLLKAWGRGDRTALDRLTAKIHEELRRIARRHVRREQADPALQATALVNETYLRLVHVDDVTWTDRAHFFAVAATMMRRILVDAARARATSKRGGGARPVRALGSQDLDEIPDPSPRNHLELIALDEALERLALLDARKARVVELRFFAGLTVEETAAALAISPQSVLRDWKLAKAWLASQLAPPEPAGPP